MSRLEDRAAARGRDATDAVPPAPVGAGFILRYEAAPDDDAPSQWPAPLRATVLAVAALLVLGGGTFVAGGASFGSSWVPHERASVVGTVTRGGTDGESSSELERLNELAARSGSSFESGLEEPTLRVEFLGVDLDGDGSTDGPDEGFFRVYRSDDTDWIAATRGDELSDQCGDLHGDRFVTARAHGEGYDHGPSEALRSPTARCWLGGADEIWSGFHPRDPYGEWVRSSGPVHPTVAATGRPDAAYLFPLSTALSPEFTGVIHVTGSVIVSGRVRGRATLVATGDVVIGDELTCTVDSGAAREDVLGIVAAGSIRTAENGISGSSIPDADRLTIGDGPLAPVHAAILGGAAPPHFPSQGAPEAEQPFGVSGWSTGPDASTTPTGGVGVTTVSMRRVP